MSGKAEETETVDGAGMDGSNRCRAIGGVDKGRFSGLRPSAPVRVSLRKHAARLVSVPVREGLVEELAEGAADTDGGSQGSFSA